MDELTQQRQRQTQQLRQQEERQQQRQELLEAMELDLDQVQVDPMEVYRAKTANLQDTAQLGKTSFKFYSQTHRTRNAMIKASRALTPDATALTLQLHQSLNRQDPAPPAQDGDVLAHLEQYPFTPSMYFTDMVREHFMEYVTLVRDYDRLRQLEDPAMAPRLERLAPVLNGLRTRLAAFCEQNRVTLAGQVLAQGTRAAQLTREDIEGWYHTVTAWQQANAAAGQLEEPPMAPEQRQERIRQLEELRQDEDLEPVEEVQLQQEQERQEALAQVEQLRQQQQDGELDDEIEREIQEMEQDLAALDRRQVREEVGRPNVQPDAPLDLAESRRTRQEAINTPSDQLSNASREELRQLNGALAHAGLERVAQAVNRYLEGTRYTVGYTEERERLKAAIQAVDKAAKGAEGPAAQALAQVQAYFDRMTNGTLVVPEGAEVLDFSHQTRPQETGTPHYGGVKRTWVIERAAYWSDQKDTPLFSHEPTVNDLKQRTVSNCYMVASTAGLVNLDPALLKDCLKDNGDGTVTVRLYRPVTIREARPRQEETEEALGDLDEDFEVIGQEEITRTEWQPVYVRVTKEVPRIAGADALSAGALWMQMIEKACAFLGRDQAKGYQSLWYGEGGGFLQRLLGVAPETIYDRDDQLFEDICNCREQGFVYNAGTHNNENAGEGVNWGHAYTIMGGKRVGNQRYVLLRNPYSTYSLQYQEDGKKKKTGTVGTPSSDETYGQFYMKYEDFCRQFSTVTRTDLNRVRQPQGQA
ncbi:C2 family cysteine protease [Pseudoflavonifractor phocaeensis]|uniref:C2 family cysteine protease n=1 Tax=Pseudoflavonifractor phocaeensis TaxID=1870988 RepID=UPI00195C1910|nr:C2 family cysteine protease [Pseudoflavonifractor phocaeensis]MBM6926149.1 hypothetical protein [Pseudoflavonifractor phocaeensis]